MLIDAQGIPTGGQFVVNGVAQAGGQEIILTPANFANTVYDVGTAGGTDTIYATLDVNGTYSAWQQFTVTAPVVLPPTLSVTSDPNATRGQTLALSNLVTILNPDNASYTQLELEDAPGTVTGGQFVVNGVAQTGGQEVDLTPANVANTVYDVGTAGGTVFLYAQLDVNGTLSGWQQLYVTAPLDAGRVVTPVSTDVSVIGGTGTDTLSIRANDGSVWGAWSTYFTISDPPGAAAGTYSLVADMGADQLLQAGANSSDARRPPAETQSRASRKSAKRPVKTPSSAPGSAASSSTAIRMWSWSAHRLPI